jgi:hypothetical protein
MGPNIGVCPITIEITGIVQPETFVGVDGAAAAAAANTVGVAPNYAEDEPGTVDTLGLVTVKAQTAIAAGALVEVGTESRAVTRTAGAIVARAIDAAVNANDRIRVILIPN